MYHLQTQSWRLYTGVALNVDFFMPWMIHVITPPDVETPCWRLNDGWERIATDCDGLNLLFRTYGAVVRVGEAVCFYRSLAPTAL